MHEKTEEMACVIADKEVVINDMKTTMKENDDILEQKDVKIASLENELRMETILTCNKVQEAVTAAERNMKMDNIIENDNDKKSADKNNCCIVT